MITENKYLSFSIIENSSVGIIKAEDSYIPITQFKNSLLEIQKVISEKNLKAILFDKRNLDTFHQPSMEWYYINWKSMLVDNNIRRHYKILPDDEVFISSVEAGKNEIFTKYPKFDYTKFTVNYIRSVDEALQLEKQFT